MPDQSMFMNLRANGEKPITDVYSASEIALYNPIQGAIAGGDVVIASPDSYLKGASRPIVATFRRKIRRGFD
jgi:hypothetical protein